MSLAKTGGSDFIPSSHIKISNSQANASNQMGSCRVFVPTTATLLKQEGLGQDDIGATVLFAYVNGNQTNNIKLWDAGNGGKWLGGLGATINGTNPTFSATVQVTNADINTVNDGPSTVHSRLNIMSAGCLPLGY